MEPDLLAGLPLLEGATPAELARIASVMELDSAGPGEVLGREGEAGRTFWLLIDGRLSVTTTRRHLADAGPGSLLGELAVLRGAPRTATVTAVEPSRFATGGADALQRILEVDGVRRQVRRLASSRLAEDLRPVRAQLRDGSEIRIRPLLPSDRDALDEALHGMSDETIRRRFFTAGRPPPAMVDYLVDIDYVDHFAWVVLDATGREGLATARYVRSGTEAEMAFTTVDRYQGHGIGTFLLGALGVAAVEAGVERLVARVMEDNVPMRAVFAKAHAHSRFDEPGLVFVTVDPAQAAAVLDPDTRGRLGSAVHDVVTAASLALRV